MTRYTRDQLRQMAIETLQAKAQGDARFDMLLLNMIMRTGLDPQVVIRKIEELSRQ